MVPGAGHAGGLPPEIGDGAVPRVRVPIIESVSAISPTGVVRNDVKGMSMDVFVAVPHPSQTAAMRVEDESMVPALCSGSYIVVDCAVRTPADVEGRIVLIANGTRHWFRRLRRDFAGHWVGVPDGQGEVVPVDDTRRILGVGIAKQEAL